MILADVCQELQRLGFTIHAATRRWFTLPVTTALQHEWGLRFGFVECTDELSLVTVKSGYDCVSPRPHVHFQFHTRTAAQGWAIARKFSEVVLTPNLLEFHLRPRGYPAVTFDRTHPQWPFHKIQPFSFQTTGRFRQENRQFVHNLLILGCKVTAVVGIDQQSRACVLQAAKPGEEVWFYLECVGPGGSKFDLLSDGDLWYPVERRNNRLTTNLNPKRQINLRLLSIVDQELIGHAIQHYLANEYNLYPASSSKSL